MGEVHQTKVSTNPPAAKQSSSPTPSQKTADLKQLNFSTTLVAFRDPQGPAPSQPGPQAPAQTRATDWGIRGRPIEAVVKPYPGELKVKLEDAQQALQSLKGYPEAIEKLSKEIKEHKEAIPIIKTRPNKTKFWKAERVKARTKQQKAAETQFLALKDEYKRRTPAALAMQFEVIEKVLAASKHQPDPTLLGAVPVSLKGAKSILDKHSSELSKDQLVKYHKLLGDFQAVIGNGKDAKASYAEAIKLAKARSLPADTIAKYEIAVGELHERLGEKDLAEKKYQEILKSGMAQGEVLEKIAVIQQAAGKHAEAHGNFARALSLATEKSLKQRLSIRLGDIAMKQGHIADAYTIYKKARKADLTFSALEIRLAESAKLLGKHDEARDWYESASSRTNHAPMADYQLARYARQRADSVTEIGSRKHQAALASATRQYERALKSLQSGYKDPVLTTKMVARDLAELEEVKGRYWRSADLYRQAEGGTWADKKLTEKFQASAYAHISQERQKRRSPDPKLVGYLAQSIVAQANGNKQELAKAATLMREALITTELSSLAKFVPKDLTKLKFVDKIPLGTLKDSVWLYDGLADLYRNLGRGAEEQKLLERVLLGVKEGGPTYKSPALQKLLTRLSDIYDSSGDKAKAADVHKTLATLPR